jgi:uncharacterized protein (TIGR02145 family)
MKQPFNKKMRMKALLSYMCFILLHISHNASAQEIVIGTQTWTSKNLDVATFRNGDLIPEIQSMSDWRQAGIDQKPAWCYYGNDANNGKAYGRIYNWYAVIDPRGLAPNGWHIPTTEEWMKLIDFLGGEYTATAKLRSKTRWNNNTNGTNESGFNGFPGGYRSHHGMYESLGIQASWWSTSEKDAGRALYYNTDTMFTSVSEFYDPKASGFYIRCVKD